MTGMLRARKARQHHGECSWGCCRNGMRNKDYRAQEKAVVRKRIERGEA